MAKKKGGDKLGITSYVLIAILVLVLLWLLGVFEVHRVENISIEYMDGAEQAARAANLSDDDIKRFSKLNQRKMSQAASFADDARELISQSSGYLYLDDVYTTGAESICLRIGARKAAAAIVSNGAYVIVDTDSLVVDPVSASTHNLTVISNIPIANPVVNRTVKSSSADNRLEYALSVASVIADYGLSDTYKEIIVKDNKEIWLMTPRNVIVIINLRFDVLHELDVAKAALDKGLSGGRLLVAGDYAYYTTQGDDLFTPSGM